MPSTRLATATGLLLAALLLPPVPAGARAWHGVEPGRSTMEEVVSRFGEPTGRVKRGQRTVLAYKGDQAVPGTREAQFHCGAGGVVEEITVFLASPLDLESIEGTYGKPQTKTFTDAFQKVWLYPQKGVTVFFDKDGAVEAIAFAPAAPPAAGRPASPSAGGGAGAVPPAQAAPGPAPASAPGPAAPASPAVPARAP